MQRRVIRDSTIGELSRARDEQDDRRAVDRRRSDGDRLVWPQGSIRRFVFRHAISLACLLGVLVVLQAYVPRFSDVVLH